MDLDTRDQHRLAAVIEHPRSLARRFLNLACVGLWKLQAPVPFNDLGRHFDLAVPHVAMDLDVSGPPFRPDGADDVMNVTRRASRIDDHPRRAGNFLVDTMLRFDFARLMTDQRP